MPELLQHQKEGVEWIRKVKRGLLGDEPGLGKSRQAIEAFDGGRNLIIAPAMVINGGTWRDELERWSKSSSGSWTVLPYSGLNQREKTSKGGFAASSLLVPEAQGHWDAVILDEAHYVKGRNTYWTKTAQQIGKNSDHMLAMTGTPIPNWAHELFTLLQLAHPEESQSKPGRKARFGGYWPWINEWFMVDLVNRGGTNTRVIGRLKRCIAECYLAPLNTPCEHYYDFMGANLGEQFLRRLRDDVLDLPPVTTQLVETPMDATQKKIYREMKEHYMTEVNDEEVVKWTDGARHVALDKISVSPWLLNPVGEPKGGKFERLRYDLQSRSRPTLVLAHYRDVVDACVSVARSTGASAQAVRGGMSKGQQGAAIQAFKDGKLDVLVGSLETVAEGLQLTVADMAIFVETSYKPYRNEQAKNRVHRLGQTRPVTILDYVTPASVDQKKRALLREKTEEQIRFMSAGDFKRLL
jgi:SNF2 family DNA or RNA helicase